MSPLRSRKTVRVGPWLRANLTHRSVLTWLRDVLDGDGRITTRPWTSWTIGRRGMSFNTRRRTARVDLPGPFSWETPRLGYGPTDELADASLPPGPNNIAHPANLTGAPHPGRAADCDWCEIKPPTPTGDDRP